MLHPGDLHGVGLVHGRPIPRADHFVIEPQAQTVPSLRSATEWLEPAEMAVMLLSPALCTGVNRLIVVPSPS